jgi:hypothetical protein
MAVMLGLALVLLGSTPVLAEESSFSIGIKGWANSWESSFSDGTTFDNGSALLIGPTVKFTSGGLFIGASYLATTGDYEANDVLFTGDSLTQDRQDLDLVIGYMLHPRFGIMAGYKSISSSADYDSGAGMTFHIWDLTIDGPAIGVTANYPFGDSGLVLVGSVSYLSLSAEYDYDPVFSTVDESDDMTGTSIEVSLAYAFTEHASANIGFKAQNLSYDTWDGDEKFSGLTFGFDYRF